MEKVKTRQAQPQGTIYGDNETISRHRRSWNGNSELIKCTEKSNAGKTTAEKRRVLEVDGIEDRRHLEMGEGIKRLTMIANIEAKNGICFTQTLGYAQWLHMITAPTILEVVSKNIRIGEKMAWKDEYNSSWITQPWVEGRTIGSKNDDIIQSKWRLRDWHPDTVNFKLIYDRRKGPKALGVHERNRNYSQISEISHVPDMNSSEWVKLKTTVINLSRVTMEIP